MPPVVAAIGAVTASLAAGIVATGIITSIATATLIAGFLVSALITVAINLAIGFLVGKSGKGLSQGAELQLKLDPTMPRQVATGYTATGGSVVWAFTHTDDAKAPNRYLIRIIALSDYPINGVVKVLEGSDQLTFATDIHAGYAACNQHKGKKGEVRMWLRVYKGALTGAVADANLISWSGGLWTSAHKGTGIAYAILRCYYDPDAFPNGEPKLAFVMEGAPCYDDRLDGSKPSRSGAHRLATPSTWAYTMNAGIITAQYLRGWKVGGVTIVGVQCEERDLADSMLLSAYNTCDQIITISGGSEARYRAGLMISASDRASANLTDLKLAMDGDIYDRGGNVTILPGATRTPVLAITDDSIVWTAEKSWQPLASLNELTNCVVSTYVDGDTAFAEKSLPILKNATWETNDGGERFTFQTALRAVFSWTQGSRITKRIHQSSRFQGQVVFVGPLALIEMEQGDWFTMSSDRWNFASKTFEVKSINLVAGFQVMVVGKETSSTIDSWSHSVDEVARTDTSWNSPTYSLANPGVYVGNVPAEQLYASNASDFYETWSNYATIDDVLRTWSPNKVTSLVSGITSPGLGGQVLHCAVGDTILLCDRYIPYDPEDLYEITWTFEVTTVGTGLLYAGVSAINVAGTNLASDAGTYHYFGVAGSIESSLGMVTFTGYFRGTAALGTSSSVGSPGTTTSVPHPCAIGTVAIAPVALINYANGSTGVVDVHSARVRKVEDLSTYPVRPWLVGDKQWAGQLVTYSGRTWVARITNIGVTPPVTSTGTATWGLFSDTVDYSAITGTKPPSNADHTNSQPVVSQLNTTTGVINDSRALNANNNFGLRSLADAPTITDSVVSTLCYIDIAAFSVYPDWGGSITYPSGTIGPVSYGTKYFIYRNVTSANSTGTSYGYSTLLSDALGTGRVYFGYITTRASSGSGGSTGGGTGGGGSGNCVADFTWVHTHEGDRIANEVLVGDLLTVLTEDHEGLTTAEVQANNEGYNWCCTLTTESGATLTLAVNTPIPNRAGQYIMAANAWLIEVPVLRNGSLTWESVTSVVSRGWIKVCKISCHQQVYAAGDTIDAMILTHNALQKN